MSLKIYVILITLTLITFLIGYFQFTGVLVSVTLLLSVLIKGELILEYFMSLKDVKLMYRVIPSIWLFLVLLLICVAYFIPITT